MNIIRNKQNVVECVLQSKFHQTFVKQLQIASNYSEKVANFVKIPQEIANSIEGSGITFTSTPNLFERL